MRNASINTVTATQKELTRACDWRKSARRKARSIALSENSRVTRCMPHGGLGPREGFKLELPEWLS